MTLMCAGALREETIANRKELYTKEGKEYFAGNLYVPDDLDVLEL